MSEQSSKVTVEYRDPSGLYPLIARDISACLPLRNLEWKSQNRPIRHIRALHLDFVPDSLTRNNSQLPVKQKELERNSSLDLVGNGTDQQSKVAGRRHQVPGLQTSPYLKIYLLRCDDKDTYKAVEREKLRQWMKQSIASKKNGNHDAFEWLIVHVVVPDTYAASEPRWREAPAEDLEELKERKQGAKWPGKSKRTVFDKLRADFNESGKSGMDRVAQIRLPKDSFPVDLLPTPAIAGTLRETQEERDKAWNDLINKVRILTLGTFDLRVKQYEADVREQESRRSMPGFNFCTFFIYKEGLAKALESVGLIEDALVIYDELSTGLENVLREIANGRAEGTATTFAPYTDDIRERVTGAEDGQPNGVSTNGVKIRNPIDNSETSESEYREKIARSSVSVFDFFSYIFERQKAIILRIANAQATRTKLGLPVRDGSEDLVLISEVCWRAAAFINNNARILRQDLQVLGRDKPWMRLANADVESLVASWSYEMAEKVLEETSSYAVNQPPEPPKKETLANGYARHISHARSDSNLSSADGALNRANSVPGRKTRVSELQNKSSLQSASESDLTSRPSSGDTEYDGTSVGLQPGFVELLTYRAALVMLQRKSLDLLAKQRGWLSGWAIVREKRPASVEEVDLDGVTDSSLVNGDGHVADKHAASSLVSPTLKDALASKEQYFETYGRLSDQAMRYYATSTQTKSAEAIIGDLAILKYQQGDYEYAISYFQHVLPLYADDGWNLMEVEALRLYATCLKDMGRTEEYARTMLSLLAKLCAKKKGNKVPRMKFEVADDEAPEFDNLMFELAMFSASLQHEITTPAEMYFDDIRCDREIIHHEHDDGFGLRVHVRHVLDEAIGLDRAVLRLISVGDANQELWLENRDLLNLSFGTNYLRLESNAVACGGFRIDKMILQAKMLRFEYDFRPELPVEYSGYDSPDFVETSRPSQAHKQPWVFLYPAAQAFNADITLPRTVQLEAARFFEIKLSSGWNDVNSLDLKLKPATAGLRLSLGDARTTDIDFRTDEESVPGYIMLKGLKAQSLARIQVPFSVEQLGHDISVRLEVLYNTDNGAFVFVTSARLPTLLPIDIDVRDTFQLDSLFSSFTIRTTSELPLCVMHAELESSAKYQVTGPPVLPSKMMVFDKHPAKLFYKTTRKDFEAGTVDKRDNALTLTVHYNVKDEILQQALLNAFREALDQSRFASLARLLIPLLVSRVNSLFSNEDIQRAILFDEADLPSFGTIGWHEILPTLPSELRNDLTKWLEAWHNDNQSLGLLHDKPQQDCLRSIVLSVDVPQVDFVHKAWLLLPRETKYSRHYPPITVYGEPLIARLKLTTTTAWNDKHKADSPVKFLYDVQAESDSWLIGGQKRGHFEFKEGEDQSFELLIIPLKLGTYSLPRIDVQIDRPSETRDGPSPESGNPTLTCETHYESAGQVVRVIRDSNVTKVHLPEAPSSGHARSRSQPNAPRSRDEG